MNNRTLAIAVLGLFVGLLAAAPAHAAGDDVTLLRVFLRDGTSLASYGEPARVADRVVFSMPTAAVPNPPLQLVNLPAERVDWERTEKYASSARAAHYLQTQAEDDYAALSNRVAIALSQVTQLNDATRRLEIAEAARKMLADWPAQHYNYRQTEVRQLLALLDDAIADLRAVTPGRLELNLLAFADPPVVTEPLMPPLTPKEAIEQVLMASRAVDGAADREALLEAALTSLDRDSAGLPEAWVVAVRTETQKALAQEQDTDRAYRYLTRRVMLVASRQAHAADVRALERLTERARSADRTLGGKRPEATEALLAAVQTQLDAARRLRLARDRWALRLAAYQQYRAAVTPSLAQLTRITPVLDAIKSLAGNTPESLSLLRTAAMFTLGQAGRIEPPDELKSAHAMLVSAMQLAATAANVRQEATENGDITRAWDASSAAAGALMLGARARAEIQSLLRPPQLQ